MLAPATALLLALPAAIGEEEPDKEHPWSRPMTFDDGQYVNRIDVQGSIDLGAGYQSDPGYVAVDDPAFQLRIAPRGAFWWQTRDLDFGVQAALFPRWYLGDVAETLQHRPDSQVDMELDVRPAERLGLVMGGRFLLDSAQVHPGDRPDAWQPWAVPGWGGDLGQGAATAQMDLQPVLAFYPEPATGIELGVSLEVDRYRFLEPQRTMWAAGPAVRMGGGPVVGVAFDLTPDLAVVARGRACWYDWSAGDSSVESLGVDLPDGSGGGLDWQAWGGIEGYVARPVHLRVLAGYGQQVVTTEGIEGPTGPGLLAVAEIAIGRDRSRQLTAGYRHGPRDLHGWRDDPYHYAFLRLAESGLGWLELTLQGGYRHFTALDLDLPEGVVTSDAGVNLWFLDWLGLGLAGFYEQQIHLEDGWPVLDHQLYGGFATLRVGKVASPEWVRPDL